MNAFHQKFGKRHVVLPVIHVTSTRQALDNSGIALEAGADGVFLINHAMSSTELLATYAAVRAQFPEWWIGLNCLDLGPAEVFDRIPDSVDGVWTEDAMIEEVRKPQPAAEKILAARKGRGWKGLYFGGVAFKYQRRVSDLAAAAHKAMCYLDVVTTSGSNGVLVLGVNSRQLTFLG